MTSTTTSTPMTDPTRPPAPMTTEDGHLDAWDVHLEAWSHADIAALVNGNRALTARVAELEGAIRKFPHFENDTPITAEAISKVAGEHVDMIMSWVPIQTKIAFVDDDGRQFEIVYEDGDGAAGIPSGWCVPEDADWQPARRGIEIELAAARKVEDEEVASAIAELNRLGWEGDEGEVGPRCADLITRLSAALKEAKSTATAADADCATAIVRAQAAETKLETASKALRKLRAMADETIRALQTKDTTPP